VPHTVSRRPVPDPGRLLSVRAVPGSRPGRVVVEIVGEVDSHTVPVVEVCLQSQADQPGVRELVVDLGGVTFLGAAAIGVLARAERRCRMRGARLVIRTGGRHTALRPLQLTGLDEIVAVDPVRARCRCRCSATIRRKRHAPHPGPRWPA
jgi:anti-sigma B factor antagonist